MMTGRLLKGTLYRVEKDGVLSEKRPLEKDTEVYYVGTSGRMRAYTLPDNTLVYVLLEDDLIREETPT